MIDEARHLPASGLREGLKWSQLVLGCLIAGAHSGIQGNATRRASRGSQSAGLQLPGSTAPTRKAGEPLGRCPTSPPRLSVPQAGRSCSCLLLRGVSSALTLPDSPWSYRDDPNSSLRAYGVVLGQNRGSLHLTHGLYALDLGQGLRTRQS